MPILYLKGLSTNDFADALRALLGDTVRDVSATTIMRLKQVWEQDYKKWEQRDLCEKRHVYFWVDGIYFNVRLDDDRQCMLVIIGATAEGNKELVAVQDGFRESKESWLCVLRSLKERGLAMSPKLAIGDGSLGFWAACREMYPETREQLCWVHKTANVLDKLLAALPVTAKTQIHNMYLPETKEAALKVYDSFIRQYSAKYPKACESLSRNKEMLFTFYDFPAEHWAHIRTTNPIESTFATVRLRTYRTKGCGSRIATLTMVFKLVQEAEKHWQRLRGYPLISNVLRGDVFVDGIIHAA